MQTNFRGCILNGEKKKRVSTQSGEAEVVNMDRRKTIRKRNYKEKKKRKRKTKYKQR